MKFKVFISSVQSEFAEVRTKLVKYIREDALLGRFFDPFIFEEAPACDWSAQQVYLDEVEACDIYIGNLTLAQALNWAGYVEQSGNGTESIIQRCEAIGLATPQYLPDNCDFKTIIWRKGYGAHQGAQEGAPVGAPVEAPVMAQVGAPVAPVVAPVGAPVAPVVVPTSAKDEFVDLPVGKVGDILAWLWNEPLKKGDIALRMGVVKKARSLKLAIDTLFSDKLIEFTIPEKPDHKQQQYRLSEKGRAMMKSHLRKQ